MTYNVIWDKQPIDFLNKLDKFISQRIIKFIKEFSENPRARQFKRLRNESAFRLRVGGYRILFDFDSKIQTIMILMIVHRKNIYDR